MFYICVLINKKTDKTMLKAIIQGNLGNPPELRQTQNGKPMTTFSVAHTERKKDQNGNYQNGNTTWVKVLIFDDINYMNLQKGMKIRVEGNLQLNSYQGNDGQTKTNLQVIANNYNITIAPKKPQQNQNAGYGQTNGNGQNWGQQPQQNNGQNWNNQQPQNNSAPQWNQQPAGLQQNVPPPNDDNVPF